MSPPLITLTTDFGLADHYVGVMKGVISTIAPTVRVIDLCHELPAYGVAEAAFTIAQSYRYFPSGTVHVVVVDPGVGTNRKALLVDAGGQRFVAPDNGVLSQVFEKEEFKAWSVDKARFALESASYTFHGRDLFAPISAYAATGKPSAEFGESLERPVRLPRTAPHEIAPGRWRGGVLSIDRFGNIVTSFPAAMLPEATDSFELAAGEAKTAALATVYVQGAADEIFAIVGSSGYLELSLREDSAAARAEVSVGDPAELSLTAAESPPQISGCHDGKADDGLIRQDYPNFKSSVIGREGNDQPFLLGS